ncbi:kelch repeat-containing protein [Melittangium boletus]|uniref:kelch repeat-containing protein n=1 Tax=Melittangium boletus TaxID=83453 RepID=UPI003DA1DCAC
MIDASGQPIPSAAVSTRNARFSLDGSGHRLFENLPPGRFLARVEARGFTSATAVVELSEGAHVGTRVTLLALGPPQSFQAERGGTFQSEQVWVSLPPDAIVDALGQPVTGTVEITIAPLDPTRQLSAMPGPLEGISSERGATVQLESVFMAEVSLWSHGAPAQLAPGKTATLEFPLPEALASRFQSGDFVPAWWFDLDAGHWVQEGTGTIRFSSSGSGKLAWVVTVNHFTWWNSDAPWTDKSCLDVLVVDGAGAPARNVEVHAEGVSFVGVSAAAYTNASGHACVEIKRGATARVFGGPLGQPVTEAVTVTGSSTAAVCGAGACTAVQLVHPDLVCSPGSFQACPYTGPAGTEGQGMCRSSRKQCDVRGTGFGACAGEVLPVAESCKTPFDDDCDGVVNEDCVCSDKQGQPCYGGPSGTEGVGICHGGHVGCDVYGNAACVGEQRPLPDACWTSADEDCDGVSVACEASTAGWAPTGALASPRFEHTATLLLDGRVLVAGGSGADYRGMATAELYEPTSGTWSATGSMRAARTGHTATLLPDGKVLVVGGASVDVAELYDPVAGTWSETAALLSPRRGHGAALLSSGEVLVAGGGDDLVSAELYSPGVGTWREAGTVDKYRSGGHLISLPAGKALWAGGYTECCRFESKVYDQASGTWSTPTPSDRAYKGHTLTRLADGRVLVTGGRYFSTPTWDVQLFDPVTEAWVDADSRMIEPREDHTATLLPDGRLLVVGTSPSTYPFGAPAELRDPSSGRWSATPDMVARRRSHAAVLLLNGKVLVVGGSGPYTGEDALASAELFTP